MWKRSLQSLAFPDVLRSWSGLTWRSSIADTPLGQNADVESLIGTASEESARMANTVSSHGSPWSGSSPGTRRAPSRTRSSSPRPPRKKLPRHSCVASRGTGRALCEPQGTKVGSAPRNHPRTPSQTTRHREVWHLWRATSEYLWRMRSPESAVTEVEAAIPISKGRV